jgi:hypothetical protein
VRARDGGCDLLRQVARGIRPRHDPDRQGAVALLHDLVLPHVEERGERRAQAVRGRGDAEARHPERVMLGPPPA